MADNDRYSSNDRNRDRDVWLDDRTGIGAPGKGYRAEWGRGDDRDENRYGDREQNYNMRRGENASFQDRDYGQMEGGRSGWDDAQRGSTGGYTSQTGTYGQGGRWSSNRQYGETERYGGGRYTQGPSRYAADDQMGGRGYQEYGRNRDRDADRNRSGGGLSYMARSNPDFYADENFSAGPGWGESYGDDQSLRSYRGQGGQMGARSYEADYNFRDHDRDRDRREGRGFWDKVSNFFTGEESSGGMRERGENERYQYQREGYGEGGRYASSHRGKGPKGYRRSDDRLREDVSDRLSDDHWLDASSIEVKVEGGEVTLTGSVKSRDDKRRAEQIAEQVSGVDNVMNHLRVEKAEAGSQTGSTGAASRSSSSGPSLTTTSDDLNTGATSIGAATPSGMGDLGTPGTTSTGTTTGASKATKQ